MLKSIWIILLLLGPAFGESLYERTERILSNLPLHEVQPEGQPFLHTNPEEARLLKATGAPREQPLEMTQLQELGQELDSKYGEDNAAKMKDPKWAQMVKLSESSSIRRESDEASRVFGALEKYRRETHAWLKKKGRLEAKGWQGLAILSFQGKNFKGQEVRFASLVEFRADRSYFQSSVGRHAWSGGYQVTFQGDPVGAGSSNPWVIPERTIQRPGKAFSTLYLGREGWFLKFHPLASGQFRIPLPTISNRLLNFATWGPGPIEDPNSTATSNAEPGERMANTHGEPMEAFLQGFPYRESSPRQFGRVKYQRRDGGRVEVGFDFSPLP